MNFYELQAFVTLADKLHFGKAASAINVSPSALSRMISRLEEEMGTVLIDRNNRLVALTPEGKLFYKFAVDFLNKEEDLKSQISGKSEIISGVLHVYASVTACYTILPGFVTKFSQRYPDVHLSIETGDPAGAIGAVRENRAMLAVAAIPENGLAQMDTVSVVKTPLVYAAAKNGPYTQLEGSPQDILSSVPIILPKTGLARTRFDKWIKSRNVKPTIAAETEGNEAILALAELNLGIGLVPQIVIENGPYKDKFVSHEAGKALGYYDVGFIIKQDYSGTVANENIYRAVKSVLQTY